MIIQEKVEIVISSNGKFYRDLGYGKCKQGDVINVSLKHLPKNSNKSVRCKCDRCEKEFERSFQLLNRVQEHLCYSCARTRVGESNKGNQWGFTSEMSGNKHPRWKENKNEYQLYKSEVLRVTNRQPLELLENFNKPRGLCGVKGAYQLDHKVSIKFGYENKIDPYVIGCLSNLQFITWEENRNKGSKSESLFVNNFFLGEIS